MIIGPVYCPGKSPSCPLNVVSFGLVTEQRTEEEDMIYIDGDCRWNPGLV